MGWFNRKRLRLLWSRWAKVGYAFVATRFIPDIWGILDTYVFVKRHWTAVMGFLDSFWGTLTVFGIGFGFVLFALFRPSSGQKKIPFPIELQAEYQDVDFDLNGVEDHVSFLFSVRNDTPYRLLLTGQNTGSLVLCGELFKSAFILPWYAHLVDTLAIEPHSKITLKVTRILEFGLAAEFAYKDPDLQPQPKAPVKLDFANMEIGIESDEVKGMLQHSIIRLSGETNVKVPFFPHYWAKYRALYENQKRILKEARDEGRKAGIQEVADWVYDYLFYRGSEHHDGLPIDVWRAQLKKWGIDSITISLGGAE